MVIQIQLTKLDNNIFNTDKIGKFPILV